MKIKTTIISLVIGVALLIGCGEKVAAARVAAIKVAEAKETAVKVTSVKAAAIKVAEAKVAAIKVAEVKALKVAEAKAVAIKKAAAIKVAAAKAAAIQVAEANAVAIKVEEAKVAEANAAAIKVAEAKAAAIKVQEAKAAAAKAATTKPAKVDVVTTASIVKEQTAFQKAVSKEGTWIIAITQDLKVDKEIIVEGEFTKPDKADATKKVPAGRKIALYSQDDKKVKTASYTLTAPKLTVKSENAKIQGGTFVGDVYVQAKGFTIVDGKVEGNLYFASQELKSAFKLGEGASVTGTTEVKK